MTDTPTPAAAMFAIPAFAIKAEEILREKAEHFIESLKQHNLDVKVDFHDPKSDPEHTARSATNIERRTENMDAKSLIMQFNTPDNKQHIVRLYHGVTEHIIHASFTPHIGITNPKDLPDFKAVWVPAKAPDGTAHGLHGLLNSLKEHLHAKQDA